MATAVPAPPGPQREALASREARPNIASCLIGGLLGSVTVGLAYFVFQTELGNEGDWVGGAIGGATVGLGGALIARLCTDGGRFRGWVAGIVSMAVAGVTYYVSAQYIDRYLGRVGEVDRDAGRMFVLMLMTALWIGAKGKAHPGTAMRGVWAVVLLVAIAGLGVFVTLQDGPQQVALASMYPVTLTDPGGTVAADRYTPAEVDACEKEKARVENAIKFAMYNSGMTPELGPSSPPPETPDITPGEYAKTLGKGTFYTWAPTQPIGWKLTPIGKPPC